MWFLLLKFNETQQGKITNPHRNCVIPFCNERIGNIKRGQNVPLIKKRE